jgi:hypothetical protein
MADYKELKTEYANLLNEYIVLKTGIKNNVNQKKAIRVQLKMLRDERRKERAQRVLNEVAA